jgi:hypothetical protein
MSATDPDEVRLQRYQRWHEQVILIVGFIGGIVFAGLVLVMGNQGFILNTSATSFLFGITSTEGWLELTAGWLAFVSGLSVITVVFSLFALTQRFSTAGHRFLLRGSAVMVGAVFSMFEMSLTLLLWPLVGSWAFLPQILLVAIFLSFLRVLAKARRL